MFFYEGRRWQRQDGKTYRPKHRHTDITQKAKKSFVESPKNALYQMTEIKGVVKILLQPMNIVSHEFWKHLCDIL